MAADEERGSEGDSVDFPGTHWNVLRAAGGLHSPERRDALNALILRYWKPVYAYVCRRGYGRDAAERTQDFFVHAFQRDLFQRADPARGRFRTFLMACLDNFLADVGRRRVRAGVLNNMVSIDRLAAETSIMGLTENETPEAIFDRTWVHELLRRVWRSLEQEFHLSGQDMHSDLFRRWILYPLFGGQRPPSLRQLAEQVGLTEKQASNRITTATRAFERLLREEIQLYASSEEEVDTEIRELFRLASGN